VPAVGTTEGAFVGKFVWGPINEIVSVGNEIELVDRFGKPDATNFESFFTAANFLSYARNLRVVRAANTTNSKTATSGSTTVLIQNRDDYETNYFDLSAANTVGMFAAKYAGELGNSLKVSLYAESSNANGLASWAYGEEFNGPPGTSTYTSGVGGANDEMHIIVIDEDGKFSGISNTVLEKFSYVSKAFDAKNDDGSSNYYVNVISESSKYIYIMNPATDAGGNNDTTTWGSTANGTTFAQGNTAYTKSLTGGVYATVTDANITTGYDKFANADEVDVSLILAGPHSVTVQQHIIDNIVETRKDCVAFISPPKASVVNQSGNEVSNLQTYRNSTLNRSSSYAMLDSGWKYQFDKYNNVYRWVPLNGDIAGLCVRTDFERDPWFSPAGFNRGQIKNVVKLAWSPTKSNRDDMYKIGINPVVSFQGEGNILYGDKTLLSKPSAFDRINVRRLFIVLEKAIARASKYSLFEFNDEFTRAQFVALVEPFLRDVQGRRGIFDYRVVCDETNNTPEVIDRNEFIGDIYIKPARSINFIQLNFVAVRTGVAFDEIVGRF
jgi:phage tail sheath protein FI